MRKPQNTAPNPHGNLRSGLTIRTDVPPNQAAATSKAAGMASDPSNFYYPQRTSASTYRVPTPPRIVVPPPTLNADSLPDITLRTIPDSDFLNTTTYTNVIPRNAFTEWTYEQRREAQLILPYLYLGPMTAAKDETWLRREGITCIMAVRQKGAFESKLMNGALRKAAAMGLEHLTVDLAGNQELIHSLPTTTALIYNHVRQRHRETGALGKVLVFCESGNERSAGVVAAYLMEAHVDVDYIKAMQLCQAQRFCANFDDGMKRLLQSYWDILCAQREVAAAQANGTASTLDNTNEVPGNAANAKRSLPHDEDEDMSTVEADDVARFGGRSFAPFVDAEYPG